MRVAKVLCISHQCGVQLIMAYSWARPAILVAGKGKGEIAGLCRYFDLVTLTYISCSSDFDTFYVDVLYLLNFKTYNHQTLLSASSQCTDLADMLNWCP